MVIAILINSINFKINKWIFAYSTSLPKALIIQNPFNTLNKLAKQSKIHILYKKNKRM
jgi:hypothetical protein